MKVLVVLFVAICCVAVVRASKSSEIKGVNVEKSGEKKNRSDKIKVVKGTENDRKDKERRGREKSNERKGKENTRERKDRDRNDRDRTRENRDRRGRKDRDGDRPRGKPSRRPECNTVCPFIAAPLCAAPEGFEGAARTFENECLLNVYNCQNPDAPFAYSYDGECKPPTPECGLIDCPRESNPFCALPKAGSCGQPQTFDNTCLLEVYNCFNENKQYEYFHNGPCETICTETTGPNDDNAICGLPDRFCGEPRTFANECYMKIYNAFNPENQYKYFHDKACENEPTSDCTAIVCTEEEYAPFCAIPDGFCGGILTFSNACELDRRNCENPNNRYQYFHDGECLTTPAPEPNCAAISCTNEGPAVCGYPDGFCAAPHTFTNECNMKVHNCFNPDTKYTKFHEGKCLTDQPEEPECPTMCPAIYDPVCAYADGFCGKPTTYPSRCELTAANCINPTQKYKYLHDGECIPQPDEPVSNCPDVCPYIYLPLCAAGQSGNVQTFPNQCTLTQQNCQNENSPFMVIHEGECDECADIKCNKIGQPVCGTNSANKLESFGNACVLQQYNCDNPNDRYEYLYDGPCADPEPIVCTKEYVPVCAFSSTLGYKTFGNKCLRDAYIAQNPDEGYAAAYDGECKQECRLGCPRIYSPICAYDSKGNEVQYSNQCEFDKFNCLNPNDQISIAYEGECNRCNTGCIDVYDPVCAVNGDGSETQYGNQCELDNFSCRYPDAQYTSIYAGECHKCSTMCTDNYDPICTYDSSGQERQWSNQCELDRYNCAYPDAQCTVAYQGECNSCRLGCPKNYAPVCAVDSKSNEVQYGNQCMLDSYNCQNRNNQHNLAYEGECHQCNTACILLYDPVCAVDSANNERQYGNECEFASYQCRYPYDTMSIAYKGECHQCATACLAIYDPVCVKDSAGNEKTLGSQCEAESYNCRYPYQPYTLQYKGECRPVAQ